MSKLRDKRVIITGASSGLGEAIALRCAQQGARLVLAARRAQELERVAAACREAGAADVAVVAADLTQPEACAQIVAGVGDGGIDYLVLNAGVSMWASFDAVQDLSVFRRLIETNYLAAVYCTHFALPHLRRNHGLIVAVSSVQGRIPVPLHSGYVASKHALEGFFETLRIELEDSGVDILLVRPSWLRGTNLRASALAAHGGVMGSARRSHTRESVALETAADRIVEAMLGRQRELVIPGKLRILPWLKLVSPRLLQWLVRRKVESQERG